MSARKVHNYNYVDIITIMLIGSDREKNRTKHIYQQYVEIISNYVEISMCF